MKTQLLDKPGEIEWEPRYYHGAIICYVNKVDPTQFLIWIKLHGKGAWVDSHDTRIGLKEVA